MKQSSEHKENAIRNMAWHDADDLRWAARNWASRIGVKPVRVQVRPMRTKWASITTAGYMTLDSGLLTLPKELGEFVIVHELVHLLAPNHGKVFKSFMHAYLPDWEVREKQLQLQANTGQKKSKKNSTRQKRYI